MPLIDHKRFHAVRPRPTHRWVRPVLYGAGGFVAAFILLNMGMAVAYRGRVLPGYSVGALDVGGVSYAELPDTMTAGRLLPSALTLSKDGVSRKVPSTELGLRVDTAASTAALKAARTWLPAWSLIKKHPVPVSVSTENDQFLKTLEELSPSFTKQALPKRVTFGAPGFQATAATPGYKPDAVALKKALEQAARSGKRGLTVPTLATTAEAGTLDVKAEVARLNAQLGTNITFSHGAANAQPGPADIGSWYEADGQTMRPAHAKITAYVQNVAKGWSIETVNAADAARAAQYALQKAQQVNFQLTATGAQTYRYCTAQRGLNDGVLEELRLKAATTFGDPRGWSRNGSRALVYDEKNCDFTLWLSAPASMPGFGDICDAYYSCRVGRNVVINFDRWQGATDPWNAAGGTLEDYRVMVINHETGHWFEFGHAECPGAGMPAPVMMQQSISLGGCAFNPWPTAAELQ